MGDVLPLPLVSVRVANSEFAIPKDTRDIANLRLVSQPPNGIMDK